MLAYPVGADLRVGRQSTGSPAPWRVRLIPRRVADNVWVGDARTPHDRRLDERWMPARTDRKFVGPSAAGGTRQESHRRRTADHASSQRVAHGRRNCSSSSIPRCPRSRSRGRRRGAGSTPSAVGEECMCDRHAFAPIAGRFDEMIRATPRDASLVQERKPTCRGRFPGARVAQSRCRPHGRTWVRAAASPDSSEHDAFLRLNAYLFTRWVERRCSLRRNPTGWTRDDDAFLAFPLSPLAAACASSAALRRAHLTAEAYRLTGTTLSTAPEPKRRLGNRAGRSFPSRIPR